MPYAIMVLGQHWFMPWHVPWQHLNHHWHTIHGALWHSLKTLRQNGHHFADDVFKCIFWNENVWISLKISLKFVPKGPINNIPALVQIMAWCRPSDKPLSEAMTVRLLTHKCITRPQWVKVIFTFRIADFSPRAKGLILSSVSVVEGVYHNCDFRMKKHVTYFICCLKSVSFILVKNLFVARDTGLGKIRSDNGLLPEDTKSLPDQVIIFINSLWPSVPKWQHGSELTLAQLMAWCLMAPSHYLNQCWLIFSKVRWHSSKGIS